MSDRLVQDQEDIYERLRADPFFADIPVLSQRKGVTESDIEIALSTLNEGDTGKLGAVAIVLMPTLRPEPDNTPAPVYIVRHAVQVIESPLLAQDATNGVLKTAEEIAQRVRQILQWFSFGGAGSLAFDGLEPVEIDPSKVSYLVHFARRAGDDPVAKVAKVAISATSTSAPATVTLTCATVGATIYYTTDGSYPSSKNDAATPYTAPFAQATAATIRAAAELADHQPSNISELTLTA